MDRGQTMRNDARPAGHDKAGSDPLGDVRDSVTHDGQSHIVNPPAERDARRGGHDIEPTIPTGDSTLGEDTAPAPSKPDEQRRQ
jgi:hypothetical protein